VSGDTLRLARSVGVVDGPRSAGLPRGAGLVATVVVGGVGLLLATGQPLLAIAPAAATAAIWALLRMPLRWPFFALVGLVMLADIVPAELPGGMWYPVTYPLMRVLLENLNKLVGIEALRFSGMELFILVLGTLAAFRSAAGQRMDRVGRLPSAGLMGLFLAIEFVGVIALEGWGIARGGADVRQSLWQIRYLLWLPLLSALAMYALRNMRDFRTLLHVVTVAAAIKVAVGLHFYVTLARPLGRTPQTVTSHADTVLWVVVLALWAASVAEKPTARRLVPAALVWGWLLLGIVINNRRTAYVSLAAAMFLLVALQPRRVKRLLIRIGIAALPLFLVYLAAGTRRKTGIFAPAASLMSVIRQDDSSSGTRDIENFNLVSTLKQSRLFGSGWGHEYVELVRAYDISGFFAQYRFIPHNSVLWLWSVGGVIGFTALWLHLGVGAFLAARVHRFARSADERVAAYAVLAVIVCYALQAWADMGVQSWTATSLLACSYAIAAKLAVSTGAWPDRMRLSELSGARRQAGADSRGS
jgi:hypothetical protein